MINDQTTTNAATTKAPETKKRTRRSKKRLKFKTPERPAPAIKEIWERASAREKEEAHKTAVAILETWLGRSTRSEAAARLGIPAVRLHQLSQLATSGLMAGLLKQPKMRKRMKEAPDEVLVLRKECERLKAENAECARLLAVFRDLPRSPSSSMTSKAEAGNVQRDRDRERDKDREKEKAKS